MRYDELYYDVCLSLIRYANEKIAAAGVPDLQFIDWDAHANIFELPKGQVDLLGPAGVGMTDEGDFIEAVLSIGVSTINDRGLFRIRKLVSSVYADLRPEQQIPIYRAATTSQPGQPQRVGFLVMTSPCIISPMSRAETRSLQFVQARGLLDPRLPSAV